MVVFMTDAFDERAHQLGEEYRAYFARAKDAGVWVRVALDKGATNLEVMGKIHSCGLQTVELKPSLVYYQFPDSSKLPNRMVLEDRLPIIVPYNRVSMVAPISDEYAEEWRKEVEPKKKFGIADDSSGSSQ